MMKRFEVVINGWSYDIRATYPWTAVRRAIERHLNKNPKLFTTKRSANSYNATIQVRRVE